MSGGRQHDLVRFGGPGWALDKAVEVVASASAGADPVSLAFAGGSAVAQASFWRALAHAHFCPGEPRLNFVVQGAQGAVFTRLLPQNEMWWWEEAGLSQAGAMLSAVPLLRWRAWVAHCRVLRARRRAFVQEHGATLHIMHLAVAPAEHNAGHGGRLLAAVLRRADSAQLAAYAEVTTGDDGRAFFRRHGFSDLKALDTGGCTVSLMARLPPAAGEHQAATKLPAAAVGAAAEEVPAGSTDLALLEGDGAAPDAGWS